MMGRGNDIILFSHILFGPSLLFSCYIQYHADSGIEKLQKAVKILIAKL